MSEGSLVNKKRRDILKAGIAIPFALLVACSSAPKKSGPINVDISNVKDIPSLILAIKQSAGNLIPTSIKNEDFFAEFADVFVKNARAAADHGYAIPQWILDKLPPNKKVVFPILGVAILTISGVQVAIPVATLIVAVLASIPLMMVAILSAISYALSPSNPNPRI